MSYLSAVTLRWLRAAAGALRWLWFQLGITLLIILTLELMAQAYLYATGADHPEDPRARADAYADAPWAKEVLREDSGLTARWYPFCYWVLNTYKRRYTHIDSSGIRATWKDSAACGAGERPFKIFMFGGSTMRGEGARDDYTIPSWLQRMLTQHRSCTQVTNFGQDGYVTTQEVILLLDRLHKGDLPDLAVFLDGYNDAHFALLSGVAGVSLDEDSRRREFNLGNTVTPGAWWRLVTNWSMLAKASLGSFALGLGLTRVAQRVIATVEPAKFIEVNGTLVRRRLAAAAHDRTLDEAVARNYLANVEIVRGIARQFGFRCLFYWQPWLGDKYPLTSYERQQLARLGPDYERFVDPVRERVSEGDSDGEVRFLNGVFKNTRQPYFLDDVHISEDGNRLIAERMLPDVLNAMEQTDAASTPSGEDKESFRFPSRLSADTMDGRRRKARTDGVSARRGAVATAPLSNAPPN